MTQEPPPEAPVLEPEGETFCPLLSALDAAEPKPALTEASTTKKNYAQRLSNGLAQVIADALRPDWPNITPDKEGRGQEARVRVAAGMKRLDVKVTDDTLGLLLSVSIKTLSFQDFSAKNGPGRFTKNVVRNDHELRGEAAVLHQRQPYAVVIGVLFTPVEAALDGAGAGVSSLAHMVKTFRKRAGRGRQQVIGVDRPAFVLIGGEDQRHDRLERMYLGLYEWQGARRGHVRFVDVEGSVPVRGLPRAESTLAFDDFIALVTAEVRIRNETAPTWTDDASDDE